MKKLNLIGKRFGKLMVIEEAPPFYGSNGKRKRTMWLCQCDCGGRTIVRGENLTTGNTKSCGCYQRLQTSKSTLRHGACKTRLYTIWSNMKERCYTKNNDSYINYGGRGIIMCDEWLDFENFRSWALKNGYADNLSIDRINVDGDYEPNNCRWANFYDQARNKRNNRILELDGESHCLSEWAEIVGLPYGTLMSRLSYGWAVKDVLKHPKMKGGRKHICT